MELLSIGYTAAASSKITFESTGAQVRSAPSAGQRSNVFWLDSVAHTTVQNAKNEGEATWNKVLIISHTSLLDL